LPGGVIGENQFDVFVKNVATQCGFNDAGKTTSYSARRSGITAMANNQVASAKILQFFTTPVTKASPSTLAISREALR
jgi:hypothetical protein